MTDTIVWVPVMVMTGTLTDVQRLIVIGSNWPDVLLEEDNVDPRGRFFFSRATTSEMAQWLPFEHIGLDWSLSDRDMRGRAEW